MDNLLGKRLKAIRDDHNLSQSDFGQRLGIVINTVGAYERGERLPEVDFLIKLANLFSVDLVELIKLRVMESPSYRDDVLSQSKKFISHLDRDDYLKEGFLRAQAFAREKANLNLDDEVATTKHEFVKNVQQEATGFEIDKNLILNCLEASNQFYGNQSRQISLKVELSIVTDIYNLLCKMTPLFGNNLRDLAVLEVSGIVKQMEVFDVMGKLPKISAMG